MASEKTNLKRHIEYLEARRSGAEWCLDLLQGNAEREKVKNFVSNLTSSIQEKSAELATIEQAEAEEKAKAKAELEAARKQRQLA